MKRIEKEFTFVSARVTLEEMAEIDDWRDEQNIFPTLSASVRHLIKLGIQADRDKKKNG